MFCIKCGNQIETNAKFCASCGEPAAFDNAKLSGSANTPENTSAEQTTGAIFKEQLGALTKTGVKGIKQAATQAQTKVGELSSSMEKSQSLKQLGDNKSLFLIVCGAMALNLILMLFKTVYVDLLHLKENSYSFIGFCSYMAKTIKELGRSFGVDASDAVLYRMLMFLGIIGVLLTVLSASKLLLPLIKSDTKKPISLRFAKIASVYNFTFVLLLILLLTAAYSSQQGIDIHLTFWGWVYFLDTIVWIISVFMLSSRLKKNSASLEWAVI